MPEPSREKPRFLARIGRHGNYRKLPNGRWTYVVRDEATENDADHGYSDNQFKALPHEPECIGPAIVDGYAEVAAFQHTLRHAADVHQQRQIRPLLDSEDRIRDLERRARHAHRDLSSETRLMREMLRRARAGGRDDPPKMMVRLERLEAELDGVPLEEAA